MNPSSDDRDQWEDELSTIEEELLPEVRNALAQLEDPDYKPEENPDNDLRGADIDGCIAEIRELNKRANFLRRKLGIDSKEPTMLRELLQAMLDEASLNEGILVKRKLKGNLHIAMVMTKKDVQISLSRDKTYPSVSEWKTTLTQFPYIVPPVAPISFVDSDRRYAMRAKLPRR